MSDLEIRSDAEIEALIQALLTATGHQVYVEDPEQTDAENLLHRATALRDARTHEQARADTAGEDDTFGSQRSAPSPIQRHPLGP